MKLEKFSEMHWRRVKFILLFSLGAVCLYIVLVKFVIKVPRSDHDELLHSISAYEHVLDLQTEYADKIKAIYHRIDTMKFDIHQVQVQDEVSKEIMEVRSVYKANNMNSKYKFGVLSANLLQIYFDTKQEHNAMIKNKKLIEDNLIECKANI